MARKEHAREDFLADATAMVARIELRPTRAAEPVLAGFRPDGSLSLLFGEDPVYQFNSLGQLRRAFVGDRMYKADRQRLLAIERKTRGGRVQLASEQLPAAVAAEFTASLSDRLSELAAAIATGAVEVVASVPAEADVLARLSAWLAAHGGNIEIAASPHAR
jgi:hypothetical protein